MTTLWATVLVASIACYGLKLAGVSLPKAVIAHPSVQRISDLLPIAMLTALVVGNLFEANRHYSANAPLVAGVGVGALALWRGRSLLTVFLLAIVVTALLRALT